MGPGFYRYADKAYENMRPSQKFTFSRLDRPLA